MIKCLGQRGCACDLPKVPTERGGNSRVFGARWRSEEDFDWLLERLDVPGAARSIAITLNLCEYRHGTSGATTSLQFIETLVNSLRRRARGQLEIVLVEHDSSGTRATDLFQLLGFVDLAGRLGVALFEPATADWDMVGSVGNQQIELPAVLRRVDLVINSPKLKLHGLTGYTGALKNNFGLVRQRWKLPYHVRLCETIVACNRMLPPEVVIVDGGVTLAGRGPAFGVPVRSGVILGSHDRVAVDSVGAKLLRVPRLAARHVALAERSGIGRSARSVVWRDAPVRRVQGVHFDYLRFIAGRYIR